MKNFYPRPPRGGRLEPASSRHEQVRISIHALREEGDMHAALQSGCNCNFYPRPPRGGRRTFDAATGYNVLFLSTPSARRATSQPAAKKLNYQYFYPRPPRGGRLLVKTSKVCYSSFLSTPSARRATHPLPPGDQPMEISIHALREEGDCVGFVGLCLRSISIHALREEGDAQNRGFRRGHRHFYPRPPRGGRQIGLSNAAASG